MLASWVELSYSRWKSGAWISLEHPHSGSWKPLSIADPKMKRALKDRGRAKELLVVASKELFTGSPSMRSKKIQARKPPFNRSNFTSVKTLQFALKLKTSTHVTLTNICLLWSRRWREEVRVSCSDQLTKKSLTFLQPLIYFLPLKQSWTVQLQLFLHFWLPERCQENPRWWVFMTQHEDNSFA